MTFEYIIGERGRPGHSVPALRPALAREVLGSTEARMMEIDVAAWPLAWKTGVDSGEVLIRSAANCWLRHRLI